jgi:hypothetical protein
MLFSLPLSTADFSIPFQYIAMAIQNPDCYFPLGQPCTALLGHMGARCSKQCGLVLLFTSYAVLEAGCKKMRDLGKDMMHELLTNRISLA